MPQEPVGCTGSGNTGLKTPHLSVSELLSVGLSFNKTFGKTRDKARQTLRRFLQLENVLHTFVYLFFNTYYLF